uniref:Uncharacterized protein n=1 Tax=Rhizophora mucronata TaxID=61149 RepID=A0A2P2N5A3_RHIMU
MFQICHVLCCQKSFIHLFILCCLC